MTLVDWVVILILLCAVISGLLEGFFRSFCTFAGLILALAIAAWNYDRLGSLLMPLVRISAIANTIGFLLIAAVVMALAGIIGNVLAKAFRLLGLGWLDGLLGGIFGLFQGVVIVVICILAIVAFFPDVHWIADARLPRMFFGISHVSSNLTPSELGDRIRRGLSTWETQSPQWMHPEQSR